MIKKKTEKKVAPKVVKNVAKLEAKKLANKNDFTKRVKSKTISRDKKEKNMNKVAWKPGTIEYPLPAVMVSCGTMEKSNIITVAWTGVVCSEPAMVYISIRQSRHSFKMIHDSKEFVINLTTKDLVKQTDWAGVRSGKDYDKFKELKLTKQECKHVKCPMIAESPISLECKVVSTTNLGSHTMFIAKVMTVNVYEEYIDKKGAFDISKCDLMAYANGRYYALGKQLGTFGFSVAKKKKK